MMFKRFLPFSLVLVLVAVGVSCAHTPGKQADPAARVDAPRKSEPGARALSHFLAATMHEERGEMDQALAEMRAASDLAPDSSSLTLRLIRAYVRNQDYENARVIAERAVAQTPGHAGLLILLGEIYHQLEDYEKAVESFQKAIDADPGNVLGYGALVSMEEKTNDLVAALDIYERLAKMTPDSAGIHFQLGLCLGRIGDMEKALDSLERALELNNHLVRAHYWIAVFALDQGQNEKAVDHLVQYLEQSPSPDSDDAREQLSAALARIGRYDESVQALTALLESASAESRHAMEMMYVLLRSNRGRDALEIVPPEDMPVSGAFFRALARKQCGEPYPEAFGALDSVDGELGAELDAYLNQLIYLYGQNDAGKFLVGELTALRDEGIKSNVVDVMLGRTLMGLDRYEEAAAVLAGVLDRQVSTVDLHYDLATCYEMLDRFSDAEAHLKSCLEMAPDDPEIMNFLGYMYAVNETNLDEAEALLLRALEIEPNNGYYLDSLGWVYYKKGDADKALEFLNKAILAAESDDAELRDHLGDIYLLKGDKPRAIAEWRRAHRLDPKLEGIKEKIEEHQTDSNSAVNTK